VYNDWYSCNADEDEYIADKSRDEIELEVPPPCFELVEYISPNLFNLIPTCLICSPLSLSPSHEFWRHLDSFMSNGINVGSDLVVNLFDML